MVQGLRAAVYARVSSEEQVEGYSLDAQRRAFRTLVEGRGWTVFQEYLEEGRSAHTDDIRKRPVFKQAIDDALAGRYDVLVVHKIDRFSRKLRVTLEYSKKLGKAGVGVCINTKRDRLLHSHGQVHAGDAGRACGTLLGQSEPRSEERIA